MIRACVIGLDEAGAAHAEAYRGDQRAHLAGVFDPDAGRARALAARLETRAFDDIPGMLDALRPDLVSVCLGADGAPVISQALERGCDVVAQVPLAPSAHEVRQLVAAAGKRGRRLAADFNLRFAPAPLQARQWITEGRLGTPLFINLSLWAGEGPLWPLAHHALDLMRWLCGDIARLQCFAANTDGRRWASAQLNLEFASAVVGGITVSRDLVSHHPLGRCEVAGTAARLVVDNIFEELTLYPHAEEEKTVITNSIWGGLGSYWDTHRLRAQRLLEQIADGAAADEIEAPAAEAATAHAAVEAAQRSLHAGEAVEIDPGLSGRGGA